MNEIFLYSLTPRCLRLLVTVPGLGVSSQQDRQNSLPCGIYLREWSWKIKNNLTSGKFCGEKSKIGKGENDARRRAGI